MKNEMDVIDVIQKYIIKDLAGIMENYYRQCGEHWWNDHGEFGDWAIPNDYQMAQTLYYGVCLGGHFELLKMFCTRHPKLIRKGIATSCQIGDLKSVKFLIKKGEYAPVYLNQGLCDATKHGHIDIANFLIKKGANVNFGLEGACLSGRMDIVMKMLEAGADDIEMGFQTASWLGHKEVMYYLMGKRR